MAPDVKEIARHELYPSGVSGEEAAACQNTPQYAISSRNVSC